MKIGKLRYCIGGLVGLPICLLYTSDAADEL